MTTLTTGKEAAPPAHRPLGRKKRRRADTAFHAALLACLFVAMAFLAALIVYMLSKGWDRLDSRLINNFPSIRHPENAGARSAILGSMWVIGGTALICLPIGIATAIYLEEYANPTRWYNRWLELNIQNLAAVPSIVFGILGLGIIARGMDLGTTIITASLTLALLVLPVVIIAAREAIRAVPGSIRQASLALGATKWQTVWKQVLPAATPGIATGSILALSRAMGEAAPLLLLGGLTYVPFDPTGPNSQYTVLPIQIYGWTSQSREEFAHLAAAASVALLILLIVMNSVAIFIRNRYSRRW